MCFLETTTSSVNLEVLETQHPSENIKVVDYELLEQIQELGLKFQAIILTSKMR